MLRAGKFTELWSVIGGNLTIDFGSMLYLHTQRLLGTKCDVRRWLIPLVVMGLAWLAFFSTVKNDVAVRTVMLSACCCGGDFGDGPHSQYMVTAYQVVVSCMDQMLSQAASWYCAAFTFYWSKPQRNNKPLVAAHSKDLADYFIYSPCYCRLVLS